MLIFYSNIVLGVKMRDRINILGMDIRSDLTLRTTSRMLSPHHLEDANPEHSSTVFPAQPVVHSL